MDAKKLGNEVDARKGLNVQLSESHIVIRLRAVRNYHSEARALFELCVGYFGDVWARPYRIHGLCVVIVPSVIGRVRSGFGLSRIKIYPP